MPGPNTCGLLYRHLAYTTTMTSGTPTRLRKMYSVSDTRTTEMFPGPSGTSPTKKPTGATLKMNGVTATLPIICRMAVSASMGS